MENIIISFVGVLIGAVITFIFNMLAEKKSLKNKAYIEIYEQIIRNVDKACKSAKNIKTLKTTNKLEVQYKHPTNYADILEKINNEVKNIFKEFRLSANDLIDLNLYLGYHQIPLNKYKKEIEEINNKAFEIIELIKQQKELYESTVSPIGCISIKEETWGKLIKNEDDLEKSVNEYMEKTMELSGNIQQDYYKDLLKIR